MLDKLVDEGHPPQPLCFHRRLGRDAVQRLQHVAVGSVVLYSCATDPVRHGAFLIDQADSLSFQVGFSAPQNQTGILEDPATGDPTFYFANTATARALKRFNANGELLQSVSLMEAMDSMETATNVHMISEDSIIVFSTYGESLLLLNGSGHIVHTINLTEQLIDSLGYSYELMTSATNDVRISDAIVFQAYCRGKQVYPSGETTTSFPVDEFYRNVGRSAHIAILRNYYDTPVINYTQYGYYNNMSGGGEGVPKLWVEAPQYVCEGDLIYTFSTYSPWVHRLNSRTGVFDSLLVSSVTGPVHVQLPPIDEAEILNGQDLINRRLQQMGRIAMVEPLAIRNLILIVVACEISEDVEGVRQADRDWSLLIYDHSGECVGETRISGVKHSGDMLLKHKDRIWLKRRSTLRESRQGLLHYDGLHIVQ